MHITKKLKNWSEQAKRFPNLGAAAGPGCHSDELALHRVQALGADLPSLLGALGVLARLIGNLPWMALSCTASSVKSTRCERLGHFLMPHVLLLLGR